MNNYYDDELRHFGVKGMKWGVRRSKSSYSTGDSGSPNGKAKRNVLAGISARREKKKRDKATQEEYKRRMKKENDRINSEVYGKNKKINTKQRIEAERKSTIASEKIKNDMNPKRDKVDADAADRIAIAKVEKKYGNVDFTNPKNDHIYEQYMDDYFTELEKEYNRQLGI